jgi:hypothetical protein
VVGETAQTLFGMELGIVARVGNGVCLDQLSNMMGVHPPHKRIEWSVVEWPIVQNVLEKIGSSFNGIVGPLGHGVHIFKDIDRDFVEGFERLLGVGSKWLHAASSVAIDRLRGHLKVEAAFMDDAEEDSTVREPIASKHRTGGDATQIRELIQDEIFEAVARRRHPSSRSPRRDHSDGDWQGDK